jgi:hypothetical protein
VLHIAISVSVFALIAVIVCAVIAVVIAVKFFGSAAK